MKDLEKYPKDLEKYPTFVTEDELHENCRIFMEQEMNITDMSLDEIPLEKFNTPRLIEQREFYMNTLSNF